jgi:hypothetical protein
LGPVAAKSNISTMAEDSYEPVTKKCKAEPPPAAGSTVLFDAVLGKLDALPKCNFDAGAVLFLIDYFKKHGSKLLLHYDAHPFSDTLSHLIKDVKWPDNLNNTFPKSLLGFIKAAKETTDQQRYNAIREKLCSSVVTNASWNVEHKIKSYSVAARSWKVGREVTKTSLQETTKKLAEWDGLIDRQLQYIAFVGSSGSGKTTAMIYSAVNECDFTGQSPGSSKLTVYLESGAKCVVGADGAVQTTTPVQDLLGCGQNDSPLESMFYEVFRSLLPEANPYGLEIPDDFWKTTKLVLALDEVPNHWTHAHFVELRTHLLKTFVAGVVLMVASTALSESVLKQPTLPEDMVKVRMLPVQAKTAMALFDSRLGSGSSYQEWIKAFSLLPALLTNQRCAEITAETIKLIVGALAAETPEDKALEHFASMSSFVMLSVAQTYLNMNGIMGLNYKQRIRLMAASLGLVSMQRVVKQDDSEVERHSSDCAHKNHASNDHISLLTKGLVDREMVGDGNNTETNCFLEWSMSPALTLVCAVTLAPWFAEINHEPDKLEVLSCIQWLAIRFIQTEEVWELQRLQQAVPRTGNDKDLYQINGWTEKRIYLNGPLAAFGDVMVQAVREDSKPPQEGKSTPATPQKNVSSEEVNAMTVANVASPRHPTINPDTLRRAKIVQAKHTFSLEAACNVVEEMAKAGVGDPATTSELTEHTAQLDNNKTTRRQEDLLAQLMISYQNGRCLTGPGSQFADATMVFVTNAVFTKKDRDEMLAKSCTVVQGGILLEFGAPAWQSFYPFSQLCRPTSPSTKVEREKYEGNKTAYIPVISTSGTNARQAGQVD